jgi:hypothetical protein
MLDPQNRKINNALTTPQKHDCQNKQTKGKLEDKRHPYIPASEA